MSSSKITILGFSIILIYIITQILNFYGIGSDSYGNYIGFYLFILISIFILPSTFPTLSNTKV